MKGTEVNSMAFPLFFTLNWVPEHYWQLLSNWTMFTLGAAAVCSNRGASDVSSPLGRGPDTLYAQWQGAKVHWTVNPILCYSYFPGCTSCPSNKIKCMSERETYCALQDNYWSQKTVRDHCDIHLILEWSLFMHLHGQRNFASNVNFLIYRSGSVEHPSELFQKTQESIDSDEVQVIQKLKRYWLLQFEGAFPLKNKFKSHMVL